MPLINLFQSDQPALTVSLLDNDARLAKAVQDAGADGIKLHTNLSHGPTGRTLGSLERERDRILSVLEAVDIPVGIVPRGSHGTTRDEVVAMRDMGFDFVDLYGHVMNPSILGVDGITTWVAAKEGYDVELLRALAQHRGVDVIEAAFFPIDAFGTPLTVDDVVRLRLAVEALAGTGVPLVMPTDRRLEVYDLAPLADVGIQNFLIGYASTGDTLTSIVAATERFRRGLDECNA